MSKNRNKEDNEVYILGADAHSNHKKPSNPIKWIVIITCILLVAVGIFFATSYKDDTPDYYFEPEGTTIESTSVVIAETNSSDSLIGTTYIETLCDTINDVPLKIYIPHKAKMSLSVGMPNKNDSTIVFAAMAADIRKDNEEIVGDFILSGKQLAKGTAKKGFCAIIDNTITIGTGEETSLLKDAIGSDGYFFRQYPLVANGELVENKPKNKSIRRAIAVRNGEVIMVESQNNESFHDFSQALVDIGISDAIYLVGGNAYGWYYNEENIRNEFGVEQTDLPETISYIIWQKD